MLHIGHRTQLYVSLRRAALDMHVRGSLRTRTMFLPSDTSRDDFLTRVADGLQHPETVFFFEQLREGYAVDTLLELLDQGRKVFAGVEANNGASWAAFHNAFPGATLSMDAPGVISYSLWHWDRRRIDSVVARAGSAKLTCAV